MSYIGVNGGMVLGVADDPGLHSSQNEQDSRNHAVAAKLPMLEPADSAECKQYAKLAYELSEKFDTPVILRLTTRVSHSRSIVELGERTELDLKPYVKNPAKNVMLPPCCPSTMLLRPAPKNCVNGRRPRTSTRWRITTPRSALSRPASSTNMPMRYWATRFPT